MEFVRQPPRFFNRIKVTHAGKPVLGLNLGGTAKDLLLMRPVVHPLYTPAGYPVTEMGAHNFPHHKGVWIGHAKINGVNCFHDLEDAGWIVPVSERVEASGDSLSIHLTNEWRDRRGTVLATEERRYQVRLAGDGYWLDVLSELIASHGEVTLEPDMHTYIGCRVLDALDVDDGGQVRDSEGRDGPDAVTGRRGNWLDYAGEIGGHACGVALIAHPSHSPMPLFARHYGTMLLNPTMHDPLTIAPGESMKIGARVIAHDGLLPDARIDDLWRDFGAVEL